MAGQLFVFSAPSGTGKSTIISSLKKGMDNLGYSVSHTSRSPRGKEIDGKDYHFVDREAFERMSSKGAFVEWARVYDDYYGTSYDELEKQVAQGLDVLLDLDNQGARNIKNHFGDAVLIFLLPPSLEALEKRLRGRGTDGEDTITNRMAKARGTLRDCLWYDYFIINDRLEQAVEEARAIITAQRCSSARSLERVKSLFPDSC